MNTQHRAAWFFVSVSALLALAAAAPAARADDVRVDAQCQPRLSRLQHRLLDKAAQDPDVLRQFVWMTRGIYGLNMQEEWNRAYVEVERAVSECRRLNAITAQTPVAAAPLPDALTAQAR
jgi:hypothetical protein